MMKGMPYSVFFCWELDSLCIPWVLNRSAEMLFYWLQMNLKLFLAWSECRLQVLPFR